MTNPSSTSSRDCHPEWRRNQCAIYICIINGWSSTSQGNSSKKEGLVGKIGWVRIIPLKWVAHQVHVPHLKLVAPPHKVVLVLQAAWQLTRTTAKIVELPKECQQIIKEIICYQKSWNLESLTGWQLKTLHNCAHLTRQNSQRLKGSWISIQYKKVRRDYP